MEDNISSCIALFYLLNVQVRIATRIDQVREFCKNAECQKVSWTHISLAKTFIIMECSQTHMDV